VVLFVLAILWTWYLVTWLHSRSEHRNVNSISSFSKHLSVLERTSPSRAGFSTITARPAARPAVVPSPAHNGRPARSASAGMTLSAAHRRRRDLLTGLGIITLVSVAAAGIAGGVFVTVAVVSLVLLGAYVALLARSRQLQAERAEKVHYLHDDAAWDEWYDDEDDVATAAFAR